jgi:hypothetical protein
VTIKDPIPPTVTRDVDALDVDNELIPRSIFGTFLERIGNSTYNRLWAELLENPSFEVGWWSPEKISEMLHDKPAFRYASNLALPLTGNCSMRVREARSSPSTSTRESLDRAGFDKVRYRGLRKNHNRLCACFALVNLYQHRQRLATLGA